MTPHSSYRLSPVAKRLLARLAKFYGLTYTGVLEWIIRDRARALPKRR